MTDQTKPKTAPAVKQAAKAVTEKKPAAAKGTVKTKLSMAAKEAAGAKKVLNVKTPATVKKNTDRNKRSVDNAKMLAAMQEQTKKMFS